MSDQHNDKERRTPQYTRMEREENIRRHSEAYGLRVCTDNAHLFVKAITQWRASDTSVADEVKIRCYNRTSNSMYMSSLTKILEAIPLDDATGLPQRLTPTAFGQVVLSPTMYVSTVIYHTLMATWNVVPA